VNPVWLAGRRPAASRSKLQKIIPSFFVFFRHLPTNLAPIRHFFLSFFVSFRGDPKYPSDPQTLNYLD
jgi:hypothetical protein